MVDGELREFLKARTLESVETGLFKFGQEGPYSNQRIPPAELYKYKDGWCELAADSLLKRPVSALIGFQHDEFYPTVDWTGSMQQVLDKRGLEIPVSAISDFGPGITYGVPIDQYPKIIPITAFSEVVTVGGELLKLQRWLKVAFGLEVSRFLTLIDRSPDGLSELDGKPLDSVMHIPLPLYGTTLGFELAQGGPYGSWHSRGYSPRNFDWLLS